MEGAVPAPAPAAAAGPAPWSAEDEAIIATNTDATECKRCAVELGYWKDEFVALFARRGERRAPEINRGYFARVRAIELFLHQFLERCDSKCQIINLGCGFDTLFWRLREAARAVERFIELDLPAVTARKCAIIKRHRALLAPLARDDAEVRWRAGELHADTYRLVGCDLRCVRDVRRALAAAGARADRPTLLLAECVLVYLRADAADELVRALAAEFPRAALLVYEQCNLADRFGAVLLRNLGARGCGGAAADAWHAGPPAAAAARLRALGWPRAAAWDMDAVWRALPDDERARAEALEMLDERELLQQLHQHYALVLATQGDAFADIDLSQIT